MNCYESHGLQNKELPFIYKERRILPGGSRTHDSNWHENVEILYIVDGTGQIYNNGHTISATKGDIFPINANHLHGLAATGKELCFRYLIVDHAFCLENGLDTNAVSFDTKIWNEAARSLMERLHTAYGRLAGNPYGILEIRSLVLCLLHLLCCEHATAAVPTEPSEPSVTRIKQAIDYIRAHYGRSISLEDVAVAVGVSSCYLSHEFRKYTGQSFVEYVNRTRCEAAEQLLSATSLSIFEIGRRCGFENRSYFAKSFRRYAGLTPSEYRAGEKTGPTSTSIAQNV